MLSWVTITRVWFRSRTMVCISFKTSMVVLESRFPVGSSAKMIWGSTARALAMPTRCCWPPDIWLGIWVINLSRPTSFRYSLARLARLAFPIPRKDRGRATFSTASMVAIRL